MLRHRRQSRVLALKALYAWYLSGSDEAGPNLPFAEEDVSVDRAYYRAILNGTMKHAQELDRVWMKQAEGRTQKDLDPVSLNVLRLGCFELIHRLDVPYRVVISEMMALSKLYGPKDASHFINAVLDAVLKKTPSRYLEMRCAGAL